MKLELKHLLAYSPYGLKAVKALTRIEITAVILETEQIYHTSYLGSKLRVISNIEDIKPILRPLSDLYKEDLVYLINHHSTDWFSDTNNESLVNDCLEKENLHHYIEFLPFGLVTWFVENHYDIFGLIEKQLAININTLEC